MTKTAPETSMGWTRLDSSVFTAVGYFERTRLLYLEFNSGAIYRYFNVPPRQYNEFLVADSHGKYFHRHILNRFSDEIVRPPRPKP